jgi:protein-S-isoprenylcysteine O-methyltransferase Ste14
VKPYYETHAIGLLYLLVLFGWYGAELIELLRQRQWRASAAWAGQRSYWPAFWAGAALVVAVFLLAPHVAPGAAIGYPAACFVIGMALMAIGITLRLWSFRALGQYFTFSVRVSPDQPVVTSGPYRLLRHPGYAGGVLATLGIGIIWGNWISMAALVLFTVTMIIWRIRTEERALLTALDDRYRGYAAAHKRLIPLIW